MGAGSPVRPLGPACCRPSHAPQISSETATYTHRQVEMTYTHCDYISSETATCMYTHRQVEMTYTHCDYISSETATYTHRQVEMTYTHCDYISSETATYTHQQVEMTYTHCDYRSSETATYTHQQVEMTYTHCDYRSSETATYTHRQVEMTYTHRQVEMTYTHRQVEMTYTHRQVEMTYTHCDYIVHRLWSVNTHHVLNLCTESHTVLERAGQGDSVGEAQPHQPRVEGGGERYGGEGHCCQEHGTDEVDAHPEPAGGDQVEVPTLGVLVLVPGHREGNPSLAHLSPVHTHPHAHTPTHPHAHTPTHRHAHPPTHPHLPTDMHTHLPTHMHMHTHLPTHMHMHTHLPTHMHTHLPTDISPSLCLLPVEELESCRLLAVGADGGQALQSG